MEAANNPWPVWAELDAEAVERNYHELLRRVGDDMKVIAAVKGNAYGHGALKLAEILTAQGVFALATGSFEEAVEIREAGIDTKILMFGSYLPEGIAALLQHDLTPTIYDMRAANAVSDAAQRPTPVYIKVDAGLGRLGVPLEEAADFVQHVAELPNVTVEGVYTHVPFVDMAGRDWAAARLKEFDSLIGNLARSGLEVPVTQARASSCVVGGLEDECNAVCVGHLLYGLSPVLSEVGDIAGFNPVLAAIKTRLIHVARHSKGRDIAIGGLYGLNTAKVTGVLAVGMASGLRNPRTGKTLEVLVNSKRVPVISVSLEHTTLDLDGVENPQVGDEVVFLGSAADEEITLQDFADCHGQLPIEILMMWDQRLPATWVDRADDIWAAFGGAGRGEPARP